MKRSIWLGCAAAALSVSFLASGAGLPAIGQPAGLGVAGGVDAAVAPYVGENTDMVAIVDVSAVNLDQIQAWP